MERPGRTCDAAGSAVVGWMPGTGCVEVRGRTPASMHCQTRPCAGTADVNLCISGYFADQMRS